MNEGTPRVRLLVVAVLCGLAAAALYLPTVRAQFVWDDHVLIERNPDLEQWSSLARGFTREFETLTTAAYYRPILMASYVVDRKVWGLDPFGFHLTNILLHGVVTGLVCAVAALYFENLAAATIGALLFALHPIQAQAVSLILGRNDLLLALAVVAMLLVADRGRSSAWVLLFYAAALWTKETGIVAPFVLLAADAVVGRRKGADWSRWRVLAPGFAIVTAIYLAMRFEAVGSLAGAAHGLAPSWGERLAHAVLVLGYYVRHALLPWNLSPAPYSDRWMEGGMVVQSATFTLVLAAAIAWTAYKRHAAAYGLLVFAIALLPVAGLVPIRVPVLEHRMYLPMVGLGLAAASALSSVAARRSLVAGAPLLVACAMVTSARLPVFHDDLALWTAATQAAPDSAYARHGYALALARLGRDVEAISVFRSVIASHPDFNRSRHELALALERAGHPSEALATIEELLRRDPEDAGGWNARAFFRRRAGDLAACEAALLRGLRVDPENPALLQNLGNLLVARGDATRAREVFAELVRLRPEDAGYRSSLDRLERMAASAR